MLNRHHQNIFFVGTCVPLILNLYHFHRIQLDISIPIFRRDKSWPTWVSYFCEFSLLCPIVILAITCQKSKRVYFFVYRQDPIDSSHKIIICFIMQITPSFTSLLNPSEAIV